jgi:predicted phosphodiesterase
MNASRRTISKLGLIGDIHAEDVRLERALEVLRARGVPLVMATGDVADGAGSFDRCCELLEKQGVITVCGNHDRWLLAGTARDLPDATPPSAASPHARRFLQQLPLMVELPLLGGLALLCHGIGPNDMAKVGPDDYGYALESNDDLQALVRAGHYRWVLNGHSHHRMVRSFGGLTVINAGTLKRDASPCFLEVDFEHSVALVFELDHDGEMAREPSPMAWW